MKTHFTLCRVVAVAASSALFAAPSCARGDVNRFAHGATFAPLTPLSRGDEATPNILDEDKRLSQTVTIVARNRTLLSLLTALRRDTGVRLLVHTDITSVGRVLYDIDFTKKSLRDVMDALAALYLLRWQQTPSGGYTLRERANINDVFLPQNDFARERAEQGRTLLLALEKMEPELRARLQSPDGVIFSQLPAVAQAPVREMLESRVRESKQNNQRVPFASGENLDGAIVTFKVQPQKQFTNYFTQVGANNRGSMGWSFNDLEERNRAKRKANAPPVYDTADFAGRDAGASGDKTNFDKRTFSLRLTKPETVAEAAAQLTMQLKSGFVADDEKAQPKAVPVNFENLKLRDALKELERAYPGTEWEVRVGSDVVIVRAPGNPAQNVRR